MGSTFVSDTEMEGTHFMFKPFNPRFPVEIFLSIIEHDAAIQDLGETPMMIAKAMSAIHLSEMEDGVLESLREQRTWEDFKCEMIKQFHLKDTLRNKVELLKSAVKQDGEEVRHFLIRARHTADSMKSLNAEELAPILFLAGLRDQDTNFCFNNFAMDGHDLDILADLINSNSENINIIEESSKTPFDEESENIQTIEFIEESEILDEDTGIEFQNEDRKSQNIVNIIEESSKSPVVAENIQTIEFIEESEILDQETGIVLKEVNVKEEEIFVIEHAPLANDALQDIAEHCDYSGAVEGDEGGIEGHAPHSNSDPTFNQLNSSQSSNKRGMKKRKHKSGQAFTNPSLADEIPNPHPKPNLTLAQLITEVLVDAPEDGFTSSEIKCRIARKYLFYKFDTSRTHQGNSNWTRKVQKILTESRESCPFTGTGEVGEKKWTLRKGYEALILKRLGWLETDRNDAALLDVFLEGFGPGQRSFEEYINHVSTLGYVANKSVETVRLIYKFWAKDSANIPVLKKKSVKVPVLKKKSTNIPELKSKDHQICPSPIKTINIRKRKHSITEAGAVVPKLIKLDLNSTQDESQIEINVPTTKEPLAIKVLAAKSIEAESSLFTCDQCDFKTELAVWLEKHKSKGHLPTYHCPEQDCFYQTKPIKESEEEIKKYHGRINYHSEHPHFSKSVDGVYYCPQECCRDKDNKFKGKVKSQILKHLNFGSNKNVICEICARAFPDQFKLKEHIIKIHGGEARFSCHHDGCGFRTNSKALLKSHVSSKHDKVLDLVCDKCPYRTAHPNNLKRHMNSHVDVSERTFYGCVLCETTATQKVSLRIHMETKHKVKLTDYRILKGPNREVGPLCKPRGAESTPNSVIQDWIDTGKLLKGVSGQILFEQQASSDFSIETKMKCHLCQEPLDGSKHAFLQHVRSHPKEQRFECTDCPDRKRYPNILPFFEHRHNKHGLPYPSGLEVYICRASESCKFKSLMRTSVTQHMECVHGPLSDKTKMYRAQQKIKRLPCPHCPAMWATTQQLNKHIEVHTQSLEDRKIHNCPKCNKKFPTPIHVRNHYKAVHLKIREYRCKICDLKFANTGNLKEHIGIKHLGYANAKEWRKSENKNVRDKVTKHEAYEYIPFKWKDEYMEVDGEEQVES